MPTINPFSSIQLSIDGNVTTVQYQVSPDFTGAAPYTFTLQAFEDNSFTEPLYSITTTAFFAVDDKNLRQNVKPGYLYRIKLVTLDQVTYYSNFVGWHPSDHVNQHKYLLASDIARRERVRFNYAGMYAYILKRKSYNPVATAEVDPVTGEPIIDTSNGSYGVGMTGGYYSPVLTRFSIESRDIKENFEQNGNGVQHVEVLKTRSAGFPFLDQHDIVVTCDGKRYIVTDPGNKYFPGTTMILLQHSLMQLVPNTDTTYNLTVPEFPNEF